MIYKLKPLAWFQKHAFEDGDEDFWETPKERDDYDTPHSDVNTYACIERHYIDITTLDDENTPYIDELQWGIEKPLPIEDYPEYYI